MEPRSDYRHLSPTTRSDGAATEATERVDLENPEAIARAISLHRAGVAVFAVPFCSTDDGTLTWIDPRARS